MTKPDWLIEAERKKNTIKYKPRTCGECAYFGKPIRMVNVLDQPGKHMLRECDVQPGMFNTRFAFACTRWSKVFD